MTSDAPYRLDFPAGDKPLFVTRHGRSVNFVTASGGGSIVLSDLANSQGQAVVNFERSPAGSAPPLELLRGPVLDIAEAFYGFAERATATANAAPPPAVAAPVPAKANPFTPLLAILGILICVGIGTLIAIQIINNRSERTEQEAADARRLASLDSVTSQLKKLDQTPQVPPEMTGTAPGGQLASAIPSAAPVIAKQGGLMPGPIPPAKTIKVRSALTDEPSPPPAGSEVVPKELPALPGEKIAVTPSAAAAPVTAPQTDRATPAKGSVRTSEIEPQPDPKPEAKADRIDSAESPRSDKDQSKVASKPDSAASTDDKDAKDPKKQLPMTPDEAQRLLGELEKVKAQVGEGNELTPELLRQLPNEIAARLVGTGIATVPATDRKDAANRLARIVRLPPQIINKYRGRDGLASIPEADSWVANGGRITIPLPGGGDVVEPAILMEFGLHP